jgi:hypothetical protein
MESLPFRVRSRLCQVRPRLRARRHICSAAHTPHALPGQLAIHNQTAAYDGSQAPAGPGRAGPGRRPGVQLGVGGPQRRAGPDIRDLRGRGALSDARALCAPIGRARALADARRDRRSATARSTSSSTTRPGAVSEAIAPPPPARPPARQPLTRAAAPQATASAWPPPGRSWPTTSPGTAPSPSRTSTAPSTRTCARARRWGARRVHPAIADPSIPSAPLRSARPAGAWHGAVCPARRRSRARPGPRRPADQGLPHPQGHAQGRGVQAVQG